MVRPSLICAFVFSILVHADLLAQSPKTKENTHEQFNQVFVKVFVPVTSQSPKQDGTSVESWVEKRIKQLGETDLFAVTEWVPVCDGLLEDDTINNRVWDGSLGGKNSYCPAGGDIPERKNGRVTVSVDGWTPGGGQAKITLSDEPGSRAVVPVRLHYGKKGNRAKIEQGLPYVAVVIAPPRKSVETRGESK